MQEIHRKNELLKQLRDEKITLPEFLQKCAEWVAEDVESYIFKPTPIKPKEVVDFEKIPETARQNIDSQYYCDHPQILAYYHLRDFVGWENKHLYAWLKECMSFLTTEEEKGKMIRKMAELPVE